MKLTAEEISTLDGKNATVAFAFDYDLKMVAKHDFIVDTRRPQGVENLGGLLVRVRALPRFK